VNDTAFVGLETVVKLDLADNELSIVPRHILHHMPNIKTLNLGWSKIKTLTADDLKV
jgi:Leucine-rich repeat (LRR) protein